MKAVILAAGLGNRLNDHTRDKPKALVQVDGRELILRVMDFLDAATFNEHIVVTGYRSDVLTAFLGVRCPGARVLFNPAFERGSIKTLEVALPLLNEGFLLLNVDHIYPPCMLAAVLGSNAGITAMCDFDRTLGPDDMKVRLDENSAIKRISKQLDTYDAGYIGMTYCGADALDIYRNSVERTLRACGDAANVEAILQEAANAGYRVAVRDLSGFGWLEVDDEHDLNRATKSLRTGRIFQS